MSRIRQALRGSKPFLPGWSPEDIDNAVVWLTGGRNVENAGGNAEEWTDVISNESVSQNTPGDRPAIATRDGKPALLFDNDILKGAFSSVSISGDFGVAMIAQPVTVGVDYHVANDDNSSVWGMQCHSSTDTWRLYGGALLDSNVDAIPGQTALVVGNFGASGSIYVDDMTAPANTGTTGGHGPPTGLTVGAWYSDAFPCDSYIWDIIVTDGHFDDSDLLKLGRWADKKLPSLSPVY